MPLRPMQDHPKTSTLYVAFRNTQLTNQRRTQVKTKTEILDALIECADAHQAADEYAAGSYQWTGKSCGLGCIRRDVMNLPLRPRARITVNDIHADISNATGIPEWVLYLLDEIFECLPADARPAWPPAFLRAARDCADWDRATARVLTAILGRVPGERVASVRALWQRVVNGESPDSLSPQFDEVRRSMLAMPSGTWGAGDMVAWSAVNGSVTAVMWEASEAAAWEAASAEAERLRQRDDLLAAMRSESTTTKENDDE